MVDDCPHVTIHLSKVFVVIIWIACLAGVEKGMGSGGREKGRGVGERESNGRLL